MASGEVVVEKKGVIPPHCGDPDGKPDPACPHHHHNRPPLSNLEMIFTLYPNTTTVTATPTLSRVNNNNGDRAAANATGTDYSRYQGNQYDYDKVSLNFSIAALGIFGFLFGLVLLGSVWMKYGRKLTKRLPDFDLKNKCYAFSDKVRGIFSKENKEGGQKQKKLHRVLSEKQQAKIAVLGAGPTVAATPASASVYGASVPSVPSVRSFDAAAQMEAGAASGSGTGGEGEGEATLREADPSRENVGVLATYNTPAAPATGTAAGNNSNGEAPAAPAPTFARD
ncbi:hypothetical protein PG993_014867 [Apiospora rasikravindrae]|uniref:Uncharacterized protein n=1 Tax=Apiospora rasikravindrae TaxID=990691 RepID=A0ABR1RNZ9_9PEZI